jgi:arylsulfatase
MLIDLRSDPFERAPFAAMYYSDWAAHRMFAMVPAQAFVANWISSFKDFPPRQKPASFSIDEVMKKLEEGQKK